MTTAAPIRAAIYARISRDADERGEGVDRQEADCRAIAKRLGWEVVAVYVDNDVSAYSGKPRPQYRAMLDAIKAGQISGVLAWHTDRLHRRLADLEEFVNIVEAHGVSVQTKGGDINLSTPDGRMQARILASVAQREIEHNRDRVKRAKADAAEKGKYRGGPRRFGFEKDGVTIRESEAAVIREMTTAVLAGRSLNSLTRELNKRIEAEEPGVAPARQRDHIHGGYRGSGRWRYGALRDMLIRPSNAGISARGLPGAKGPDLEEYGPAEWDPIVSEEEWRAVVALLTDPARRTNPKGSWGRWLGSGLYTCSLCGAIMRAAPYGGTGRDGRKRRFLYRCTERAHLTVSAEPTDEFIREVVAERIRDPRVIAALAPGDVDVTPMRQERQKLVYRLEQFERDYASGQIDGAQLKRATDTVTEQLTDLDERMATLLSRSTSSALLRETDPGAAFLAAPLDVQRAVMSTVVRVEVLPYVGRPGGVWTSDRLRVTPVGVDSPTA
jgi:DNA invertase Pin-like site-specific DNA recombinase